MIDLLHDFREHGAEAPFFLHARLERQQVAALIDKGYLSRLEHTPAGPLLVLGARGRQLLSLSLSYRTPPEVAADQFFRRRVLAELASWGFVYLAKSASCRDLVVLRGPTGRRSYLLARWRALRAGQVARVLAALKPRLLADEGVLLVRADSPRRLSALSRRSAGLVELI